MLIDLIDSVLNWLTRLAPLGGQRKSGTRSRTEPDQQIHAVVLISHFFQIGHLVSNCRRTDTKVVAADKSA